MKDSIFIVNSSNLIILIKNKNYNKNHLWKYNEAQQYTQLYWTNLTNIYKNNINKNKLINYTWKEFLNWLLNEEAILLYFSKLLVIILIFDF